MNYKKSEVIERARKLIEFRNSLYIKQLARYRQNVEQERVKWQTQHPRASWTQLANNILDVMGPNGSGLFTTKDIPKELVESQYNNRIEFKMFDIDRLITVPAEPKTEWLQSLISQLEATNDDSVSSSGFKDMGFSPSEVRELFRPIPE